MPPFALYFAGIGTVVAALSLGFAGAMFLTSTKPVRDDSTFAAKVERHRADKVEPVTEPVAKVEPPAPAEPEAANTSASSAPPTTTQWVSEPPVAASVSAPVVPLTAPLNQPGAQVPAGPASTATTEPPRKAATPAEKPPSPALTKKDEIYPDEKKQVERPKVKEAVESRRRATTNGTSRYEKDDADISVSSDSPERTEPLAPPPGMKNIGTVGDNSH